ncbi:PRC-barrel domain-containing protein [Nitrosomonas sp. Nm51]|uniref:PRC-barrel domain-containing protein n=1 Tax=Nitrosomonas sp. Nm51 TaxID=133720 RepID=UPI0008B9894F|nr:PRC-barrel domain-containing protein [Nitrosomonas sp. Nm51]SER68238.1 PRC-barrel domain-containing protein [Nitrosomonas sp. Nm51]
MTRNFFHNRLNLVIGLVLLMYFLSSNAVVGSEIDLGGGDYTSGRDTSVKQITGIEVIDKNRKKIGTVNDLLIDKNSAVAYAVIYVGGVYGVESDKQVAVPFDRQRIIKQPTDTEKVLALNVSLQALQQEPAFKLSDADAGRFDNTIATSKIIGLKVFGKNDNLLGVIHDLIVNNSHNVVYAVILTSGVSGISDKLVAAPYGELNVNENEEKIILNITDNALEMVPGFQY